MSKRTLNEQLDKPPEDKRPFENRPGEKRRAASVDSSAMDDPTSPIRRLSKEEQDSHRRWPNEKHLASAQDIPLPEPGKKNAIQSVLFAMPILMLVAGLFVYFKGESAQINGEPILAAMSERSGQFKSVSEVSGIGKARYYLWYTEEGRSRGVRISEDQKLVLEALNVGDNLSLQVAPTVEGSKTLWVYSVAHEGTDLVLPED